MFRLPEKFLQAWKRNDKILHLSLICLAGLAVWGATCGLWSLSGADEPRYTLIAKELIDNGNVFLLTVSGEPYDQKPPLIFWLFAVALKICGGEITSFAPRFVAVIFALISLFCTYTCGRKLLNARTGFYSAFILAAFPLFLNHATKARLDMVFASFITISITAVITRDPDKPVSWLRALAIWGGLAGAFFVKGPLALLIVLIFIMLCAVSDGKGWWRTIKQLRFFWGLFFVFALIAAWLAIEVHLVGPSFVTNQIGGETIDRAVQGDHKNPLWFYFAHIFEIIGVWLFVLLLGVFMRIKRKVRIPHQKIWLFWFLPGFIMLCLASGKRIAYILPLLPPLALFIGFYAAELAHNASWDKAVKFLNLIVKILCVAAGAAICVASVIIYLKLALAWTNGFYISGMSLVCAFIVGLLFIGAGLWRFKPSHRFGLFCGTVIFMTLLANFFVNTVIYPSRDVHNTSRYFSQNLTRLYPELLQTPLGVVTKSDDGSPVYNVGIPRFHVYGQYKTNPVTFNRKMFATDAQTLPDFVLVRGRDMKHLETPPEAAGFSVVFWDKVENKYDLVLLRRQSSQSESNIQVVTTASPLLLAQKPGLARNSDMSDMDKSQSILPAGFLFHDNTMRRYLSENHTASTSAVGIYTINHDLARIYSLNMQKGFAGNAYAVNWFMENGRAFPTQYNLLVLANLPLNFKTGLPYNRAFNKALLKKIMRETGNRTVFFTGPGFGEANVTGWDGMLAPSHTGDEIVELWLDFAQQPAILHARQADNNTISYPLDDAR